MTEPKRPSSPDFEALAEAYFDEVIAPTLSILTEKHQGYMHECFMGACEMSTAAKVGLNLWAAEKGSLEVDRG